jgi:hypothetical protein
MGMILKVDVVAGTDVKDAARQMIGLAGMLGVMIETSFNGVTLLARWDDTPERIAGEYRAKGTRLPPGRFGEEA